MRSGGAKWRMSSPGLEVETPLRAFIEDRLRARPVAVERRVGHVPARLHGESARLRRHRAEDGARSSGAAPGGSR
jgi:hypothetical protein